MTVIGAPLKARAFAAVAGRIADTGANIDRIERMARYPVTAIELHVSGADTATLRSVLSVEAAGQASTSRSSRPTSAATACAWSSSTSTPR